jgi:hypothetical protein
MTNLKYYFCESCGNLITSEQIDDELSNGGMGYCDCQYMQMQWDTKSKSFEPVYLRHYPEWTEIPGSIYSELLKESNTICRHWMFSSIPKQDRSI